MKRKYWLLAIAAVLYLAILIAHIQTRRPWNDEAWFAIPAENLAFNGFMGITNYESAGTGMTNVNRYAFIFFPLNVVVLAGWFKIAGSSLFAVRILSSFFAMGLIAVFFFLIKRWTQSETIAWITLGLLTVDYQMMVAASFGRYEPLVSLLGFGGYYAYLALRERDLRWALAVSNALICLCGMTHPNGLMFFAGLAFLILYHDRSRLDWGHIVWVGVPYLLGAAAWGNFIMKSPQDFQNQMRANSFNRIGLADPIGTIHREMVRYLSAFGFSEGHSAGLSGPSQLKIIVLFAYIFGVIWVAASKKLRSQSGIKVLLWLTLIHQLYFTFIEGIKFTYYVVHMVGLLSCLLAIAVYDIWSNRRLPKWIIVGALALIAVLQVGGVLFRIRGDTMHKGYVPAITYIEQHAKPTDLVMASLEICFQYGLRDNWVDDIRWGFYSGKVPKYLVLEEAYEGNLPGFRRQLPKLADFMETRLNNEYSLVHDQGGYKIYERKQGL